MQNQILKIFKNIFIDFDGCLFLVTSREIIFTNMRETKADLSRAMRKPTFCIYENKDADQLRGNREADQRLCFRCIDSTIPLLSKSEISSFKPSPVVVQPGLCPTRSETRMLFFS